MLSFAYWPEHLAEEDGSLGLVCVAYVGWCWMVSVHLGWSGFWLKYFLTIKRPHYPCICKKLRVVDSTANHPPSWGRYLCCWFHHQEERGWRSICPSPRPWKCQDLLCNLATQGFELDMPPYPCIGMSRWRYIYIYMFSLIYGHLVWSVELSSSTSLSPNPSSLP